MTRYAIVRNADSRRQAEAYLPGNYRIIHEAIESQQAFNCVAPGGYTTDDKLVFVIAGVDYAGWTLDGYVIPRYASGLIWVEEIATDHPILKVPYYGPLCPALLSRDHPKGRGRPTSDGVCEDCGHPIAVDRDEPTVDPQREPSATEGA